jgi:hypothetical protein
MVTRRERILRLLEHTDGLTDREITDQLEGHSDPQQPINQLCRRMEASNILVRKKRGDGLIGNYLIRKGHSPAKIATKNEILQTKKPTHLVDDNHPQITGETSNKLLSLGFTQVGRWFWDVDDLNFELTQHTKEKDILYAFAVNGDVKYIGKSVQTLHKRIYFYKNCGPSQTTNIRVRDKLRASLKNGAEVLIFAFVQNVPLMIQDIPINLAAGLEDNLIASLKPEWNIR